MENIEFYSYVFNFWFLFCFWCLIVALSNFFFFFFTTLVILAQLLFLWGYVHACSVTQSCLIHCDPMDCSLPGFSVHGIFQTRTLERAAISFSRGFSQPRDQTYISCGSYTGRRILHHWATWQAPSVGIVCIIS